MKEPEFFELEREHLVLLSHLYVELDGGGGEIIGEKRPYGNSDAEGDIADILGIEGRGEDGQLTDEQRDELTVKQNEVILALKVVLQAGQMVPGMYERVRGRWRKADG